MSIRDAILARNKSVTVQTDKIFKMYGSIFKEIFSRITGNKFIVEPIAIDLHPVNSDFLSLIGMSKHKVGDTILTESGNKILIDKTNVDSYTRAIRIILPYAPVEANDINTIIQFLNEYSVIVEKLDSETVDIMLGDTEFLNEMFSLYHGSVDNPPKTQARLIYDGFDLTDLNLDHMQLLQLKLMRSEGQS